MQDHFIYNTPFVRRIADPTVATEQQLVDQFLDLKTRGIPKPVLHASLIAAATNNWPALVRVLLESKMEPLFLNEAVKLAKQLGHSRVLTILEIHMGYLGTCLSIARVVDEIFSTNIYDLVRQSGGLWQSIPF